MAFVGFYIWTFEQTKKYFFPRVHRISLKGGFWVTLVHTCYEKGLPIGL